MPETFYVFFEDDIDCEPDVVWAQMTVLESRNAAIHVRIPPDSRHAKGAIRYDAPLPLNDARRGVHWDKYGNKNRGYTYVERYLGIEAILLAHRRTRLKIYSIGVDREDLEPIYQELMILLERAKSTAVAKDDGQPARQSETIIPVIQEAKAPRTDAEAVEWKKKNNFPTADDALRGWLATWDFIVTLPGYKTMKLRQIMSALEDSENPTLSGYSKSIVSRILKAGRDYYLFNDEELRNKLR